MAATAPSARALDAYEAERRAAASVIEVEASLASLSKLTVAGPRQKYLAAERIAAADLLMRSHEFQQAQLALNQVLELYRQGKAPEAAYVDALMLIGECYFRSGEELSARRAYREIVDHADRAPYAPHQGVALGRLVDIVLRTGRSEDLDYVFAKLQGSAGAHTEAMDYAQGKALYASGRLAEARGVIGVLAQKSQYAYQAGYLLGVLALKEAQASTPAAAEPSVASAEARGAVPGASAPASPPAPAAAAGGAPEVNITRYAAAVEAFRKVTTLPQDTAEHRHIVDLAWMAMGRLAFETGEYIRASQWYSRVRRDSPEFNTMLYELAWVYVRLGAYRHAERALEVLAITDPGSLGQADSNLLRADLMLRSGKFDEALKLYGEVRGRFDPMREQVRAFMAQTTDPAVFYDRLVEEPLEKGTAGLPDVVMRWVREGAEEDDVFRVIDDVSRSRDLIRDGRRLAAKLGAVLGSTTRVKAFPEVKGALERVIGALNRLALARYALAQGLEDEDDSTYSGEVGEQRQARRGLMRQIATLPVYERDFLRREAAGERAWNGVSQRLQRLTLEADRLQALVNGLHRVLGDADRFGVTADVGSRQRFADEVAANERDLQAYRDNIKAYREAIEVGRAQAGFGDDSFADDERARLAFNEAFAGEVHGFQGGRVSGDGRDFALKVQPLLARMGAAEAELSRMKAQLDAEVERGAVSLRELVATESQNLERYAGQLDDLDQQARVLVGEVAMKNFASVAERLRKIVLRADVGIVQEAWEVRENHLGRVRDLQRERAREEQNLNDELREVLDDAGGEAP